MKKLTTLSLIALTSIASAEQFYISAEAGRAKLNQQISLQGTVTPYVFINKPAPFVRFALGYQIMDNLRAELDFTNEKLKNTYLADILKQQYIDLAAKDTIIFSKINVRDRFNKKSFGLSFIYDFDLFKNITGFAGIRVGFGKAVYGGNGLEDGNYSKETLDYLKGLDTRQIKSITSKISGNALSKLSKTSPEFGFVFGANYHIDENLLVGLTYRFNLLSHAEANGSNLLNTNTTLDITGNSKNQKQHISGTESSALKTFDGGSIKSSSSSIGFNITYKF